MGQSRLVVVFVIAAALLDSPPLDAGQAYNPFTGKTDLCSTIQNTGAAVSASGCQTIILGSGLTFVNNGDGTYTATASAGSGDITDVGSCATGACFTSGSPSSTLTFNNATSGTVTFQTVSGALGTQTVSLPAATGTMAVSATSPITLSATGAIGLSTPLSVGNGGSGVATFTTNGVLYGNATTSVLATAQGPTNSVLTASAGAPSFSASPTLTGVSVTNNVQWLPATGTQFEAYASGSQWFLTDLTNGNVILRVDNSDRIFTTQTVDFSGATLKGIVPNRELVWTASSLLPLEFSADAIPPVTKNTGTNVDTLTVDYDDTATECREVTFQIPANVDTNGLVTLRLVWFPATAVANNVVWDIRHVMRATGQTWDAALTTYTFPASTASASANVVTIITQSVPINILGWTTSSNYVLCELCRSGGNAGDTLVGDAKLIQFGISMPRLR